MTWLRELSRFVALHAGVNAQRREGNQRGIVVSLTSIPSRIGKLGPTLRSLLDQTLAPERIFLTLPKFSTREQRPYRMPDALPGVTLLESDRDWGPATKIIPVIEHLRDRPDDIIIVVDDDNVYPSTFIETLAHHAQQMPDAALGLRGWNVPASLRWQDSGTILATAISTPMRADVLTGCGGILVRPRFFDAALRDQTPHAFYADDPWISGHLAKNRVDCYVVPFAGARIHLGSVATLFGPALNRTDNRTGVHNDAVIAHYKADWPSHHG